MKNVLYLAVLCFFVSTFTISCKKSSDNNTPTTGTIKGKVTNNAAQGVASVRITVYDANTNAPTGSSIQTGSDGSYQVQLNPGTYYLTLNMQGFNAIPTPGITPVSITVEAGKEVVTDFQMQPSTVTNGGYISGKVSSGGKALSGVLVIASDSASGSGYSSVSGTDGTYYIYNVPVGTYKLQGFLSSYNSPALTGVSVTANTETSGKDLAMTSGTKGCVKGKVSFLSATGSSEVDVELTDLYTKETIPGLVTKTQGGAYTISNVPNGSYIARASYVNDGNVVDPDWIVKFGEPIVTVSGDSVTQDFSVTGAVHLVTPTNDSLSIKPVEITDTIPTFTWVAYPSTSDYVIEVSDINGNVIWGGFNKSNSTITKNIIIKSSQLSIVFNSDGKATLKSLNANVIYRWRIYASKNDVSTLGWHLISMSEDQMGLFIIK